MDRRTFLKKMLTGASAMFFAAISGNAAFAEDEGFSGNGNDGISEEVLKNMKRDEAPNDRYEGKSFAVIGDSISTYSGWIPQGYEAWYPHYVNGAIKEGDVESFTDTWWYKLSEKSRMTIHGTYSWSGSTIADCRYGFVTTERRGKLGENALIGNKPNVIFIFGGTNDYNMKTVDPGEVQYSDWKAADLKKTLNAFCYLVSYLKMYNPASEIINIVNTGLSGEISDGMQTACDHYKIKCIHLDSMERDGLHPTKKGMTQISDQIYDELFQV